MQSLTIACAVALLSGGVVQPAAAQDASQSDPAFCVACHAQDSDREAPNFATIAAMDAEYLAKQLREYKSGRRANDVMTPIAATLTPKDITRLAAHFRAQVPVGGVIDDPALAERGKALYERGNPAAGVPNCGGCHQPNGAGSARYPRLAGQLQAYTIGELTDFKNGDRTNDRARVMRLIASRMSDEDMRAVAEYIAGMTLR